MLNNHILRSLRGLLEADAAQIAELARLSGGELDVAEAEALLRRPGEPGWRECSDAHLAHVLDGLVIRQRGRDDDRPPRPIETPVTNNMVLKKLRAAFELHDEDVHAILESADVMLSKGELNALFRKPDNKHYRPCSDELLEAFLEGLAMSGWGGAADDAEGSDQG
jgi:uncharacterized protein YehS (DUF1456 family)